MWPNIQEKFWKPMGAEFPASWSLDSAGSGFEKMESGINNADGTYDFHSHGKYDQIIYVAPRKNVVIVRLRDRLDENVTWALVIHNIVDQLR